MKEKGSFSKKSLFVTLTVLFVLALLGGSCNSKQSNSPNDQLNNDSVLAEKQVSESSELQQVVDSDSIITDVLTGAFEDEINNEPKSIVYSSSIAFSSKESVLSYLSNKTFKHNEYSEIKFDEHGIVQVGREIGRVNLLQCSSQSALIQYTAESGHYYRYLVRIDDNKLQVIYLQEGSSVYYQEGGEDYSSYPSIYSSTISFNSEEDVLDRLSGRTFRNNRGLEFAFDDDGSHAQIGSSRSNVLVLSYVSQSALIKCSGSYCIVQIDEDTIQLVDSADGTVFH